MRGAVPPFPRTSSWGGACLRTGTTLSLTLPSDIRLLLKGVEDNVIGLDFNGLKHALVHADRVI
jgi:hypothetical protein